MLFLLIACAAGVYLWQHAPALFLVLAAGGLLWYVVIPLCLIVVCGIAMLLIGSALGLSWLANALPEIPGVTTASRLERWVRRLPEGACDVCGTVHAAIVPQEHIPLAPTVWGPDKPWKTEAQYRNAVQVAQWDKARRLSASA